MNWYEQSGFSHKQSRGLTHLQTDLDNASEHRNFGKLHSTENFNFLREQFLDVAHEAVVYTVRNKNIVRYRGEYCNR